MLRQFGCGSNPGDQTVGARGTRGGLASPDWLEQETSEETSSPAVLWPSEDTRTCIRTANKPNADGSRWLLREEQGASKGRGSISRQLIIADNEKGDSGLKQGLLFPLDLSTVYVGGLSQTANSDVDRSTVLKCSSRVNIDKAKWRTLSMRQCVVPGPRAPEMHAGPVTADGDGQ